MERVKVEFETITPLWTGDAWGECKKIRPSSIMGSLRFWFEVYCHFAGIDVSYEKENLDYKWFNEKLKSRVRERFDVDVEKIALDVVRERLTLPSLIFGCTGWRSRVEIESIRYLDDYCFGNRLNLPNRVISNKNWFFSKPYFFGKFEVVFKTTEEIRDNILLPLLNFIQNYGFLGVKNNIGYGRVRVLAPDLSSYSIIKISKFIDKENITLEIFQKTVLAFPLKINDKLMLPDKIYYCETNLKDKNLIEIIKKIIDSQIVSKKAFKK